MTSILNSLRDRRSIVQLVKVGLVGVANTAATFVVYNLARFAFGITASLMVAFAMATAMSYVLNRRWSFELSDGGENLGETWRFFLINAAAWAVTEALMRVARTQFDPLSRVGENVALLVISGLIVLPKFLLYRHGVFGKALGDKAAQPAEAG